MRYTVLTGLERAAARYPQKTAVVDECGSCTYAEYLRASQRVGSALIRRGIQRAPVAVFMEKGRNALFSFFGALYSGGFYAMFNPELPETRLKAMAETLAPKAFIADETTRERAVQLFPDATILTVENLLEEPADDTALRVVREGIIDTDPVYVNFTSGSTGTPKGIAVSHRSVLDFIECFAERFHFADSDVIANQAPFDFDVSVKDIYTAMEVGTELIVVPRRLFSEPAALMDFLCDHQVTAMIWAVSALCLITTFHALDYRVPDRLRMVLFSGEVMPVKHLKRWRDKIPSAMYVNLYGPTEITCNCTYHVLDPDRDYSEGIPIGVPFPNEEVFLLDEDDREVTGAGEGEICVRGTALAIGYYNQPAETQKRFTNDPRHPELPQRIYRTGDLGMRDKNGEIFFRGRRDFQIKLQGHRVELEEVERAMQAVEGVARGCCTFDEKHGRLKGYYVGDVEPEALYQAMIRNLPAFMVPGQLRKLDALPLNKNGKIDRKKLDELAGGRK